eukprot:2515518-Prymnesium_polylepis.2
MQAEQPPHRWCDLEVDEAALFALGLASALMRECHRVGPHRVTTGFRGIVLFRGHMVRVGAVS